MVFTMVYNLLWLFLTADLNLNLNSENSAIFLQWQISSGRHSPDKRLINIIFLELFDKSSRYYLAIYLSCAGVGRGAGQDRAEARGPVQVRPRLLQLQENREVRCSVGEKNRVKMSGSWHGGELSQLMRWYIVLIQSEYHKAIVMPSFHEKNMSDLSKKCHIRPIPPLRRNPCRASFRVKDVSFVAPRFMQDIRSSRG